MANPHKGEIEYEFKGRTFTFKFSNAGKVETETYLGAQGASLAAMLDEGMGARNRTGLFFGATRKFHAPDFPRINPHVNNFMDELDDAVEEAGEDGAELTRELDASLLAAFMRVDKKRIKDILSGRVPDQDDTDAEAPKEKGKKGKAESAA